MITRRNFIGTATTLAATAALASQTGIAAAYTGPYMATGVKIGEVTGTSAIVWTRLTRAEHRIAADAPIPTVKYRDSKTGEIATEGNSRDRVPIVEYPNGATVDQLEGAAPGLAGRVSIRYSEEGLDSWSSTSGLVDPERDYVHQFVLTYLKPNTRYEFDVTAFPLPKNPSHLSGNSGRCRLPEGGYSCRAQHPRRTWPRPG